MKRVKRRRLLQGGIIGAGILYVIIFILSFPQHHPFGQQYGVTFSPLQAAAIGLDWRETYDAVLEDLGVRHLRLIAYWDRIEPEPGRFDFRDLDYQMDAAVRHGARVVLVIGRKVPRWPECHEPFWARSIREQEKQGEVLEMIRVVIERYRNHSVLSMWQLENEPLFAFGECPPEDPDFLAEEEALVRSLDPDHQILITDSGELSSWLDTSRYGDLLGTTMYRTVLSHRTGRPFHYDYIFPAWAYRLKAGYIRLLSGKEVIISELQGEPWGEAPYHYLTQEERHQSFSPQRFQQIHRFAQRTSFPQAYWWGAEYWYWEKEVNGNPVFWDIAKEFFGKAEARIVMR